MCFVAGAYRTQLALCISAHLSAIRETPGYCEPCLVCSKGQTKSCRQYQSWPRQVAFKPLGPDNQPWGASTYYLIGKKLVLGALPAARKIMDLGRAVQQHLDRS